MSSSSRPDVCFEGALGKARFSADKLFNFALVKNRTAFLAPRSPWAEIQGASEAAWRAAGDLLDALRTAPQLQQELKDNRQARAWSEEVGSLAEAWQTTRRECVTVFVGAGGDARSRLLSLLVGEEELLPLLPSNDEGHAPSSVCCPIELRHCALPAEDPQEPPCGTPRYQVEFVLFSRHEFVEMQDRRLQELLDYWRLALPDSSATVPARKPPLEDGEAVEGALLARRAHDWLEAVHGSEVFHAVSEWSDEEAFRAVCARVPDIFNAESPGDSHTVVSTHTTASGECGVARELRNKLGGAGSSCNTGEGQVWPLVKVARVYGPWHALAHGVVLVDLPGFGDGDEILDNIARPYYEHADFCCVVGSVEACDDKLTMEWLRRAERDFPRGAVVCVCANADGVAVQEVIDEGRLPPRTTRQEAARHRNEKVKSRIRARHQVEVFTVSPRDYGRCVGLEDARPETFKTREATEVPMLLWDIVDKALGRRSRARLRTIRGLAGILSVMELGLREEFEVDVSEMQKEFRPLYTRLGQEFKERERRAVADVSAKMGLLKSTLQHCAREGKENMPTRDDPRCDCEVSSLMIYSVDRAWIGAFEDVPAIATSFQRQTLQQTRVLFADFAQRFEHMPELHDHAHAVAEVQLAFIQAKLSARVQEVFETCAVERRGYAEELRETVGRELAAALLVLAEKGAVQPTALTPAARRERRTVFDGTGMNLLKAVVAPQQRTRAVLVHFERFTRDVQADAAAALRPCFDTIWQSPAVALEREALREYRSLLESKRVRFDEAWSRLQSVLPREPPEDS